MTKTEWNDLQIGQKVYLVANPELILTVGEIATDERSLQNWINRGYSDIERIIKFSNEDDSYHTWDYNSKKWNLIVQ